MKTATVLTNTESGIKRAMLLKKQGWKMVEVRDFWTVKFQHIDSRKKTNENKNKICRYYY